MKQRAVAFPVIPHSPLPVLRYDFESIDNNKITDISGNHYHGTIQGSGCTEDKDLLMGPCLEFTGGTGHVSLPDVPHPGTSVFAEGITITMWVNLATVTEKMSLFKLGAMGVATTSLVELI